MNWNRSVIIALISFLLFTVYGCDSASAPVASNQASTEIEKILGETATIYGEIDELEKTSLIFMREEEKVARDVYQKLFENYGLRVFGNITKSEQTHMDAVKVILDKYEIEDPVVSDVIGIFQNTDLQALYNTLSDRASISVEEALKVGALIEEVDIVDLGNGMAIIIENDDLLRVYTNLQKGSENHLRAFVTNLKSKGIDYQPVVLDSETYQKIINR